MNREQIMDTIYQLSNSQGCYSRLYKSLQDAKENDPDRYEDFMNTCELMNLETPVDLILALET